MTIYNVMGYGKGKTTSAIGIALRALAQGEKVLFVQFLKDGQDGAIKELVCNYETFTHIPQGTKGFKKENCQEFWNSIVEHLENNSYHLVIFDELNIAFDSNLFTEDIKFILEHYLPSLPCDIYITGRINSHELRHKMYDVSDLVTNCYCEVHPFNKTCKKCGQDWQYYYEFCPICGATLNESPNAIEGREF